MASPFPGMDPYIEGCGLWGDFYSHLVERISDALADAVPDRYLVRAGERSYLVLVETEGKEQHAFLPDVSVKTPKRGKKPSRKRGGAALAEAATDVETITMQAFIEEEHREAFVEIYEADGEQQLVTCIEVLSPSNKQPKTEGWNVYLRKRQSLMLSGIHLVEIDLLRGGRRMPMLDPWPDCPYTVLVAKSKKGRGCLVYRAYFQHRLPVIGVPLAKPDPDLPLDLQPIIDSIYQRYRYERSIDYTKPLTPPLNAEENAWLKRQLKAKSKKK